MYKFKTETEERRFNTTLNKCIEAFKNEKERSSSTSKKLKKAVDCNLNLMRIAILNHRQGTDFYTYELYLVQKYLDRLYESGLYQFEDYEISVFNSLALRL